MSAATRACSRSTGEIAGVVCADRGAVLCRLPTHDAGTEYRTGSRRGQAAERP